MAPEKDTLDQPNLERASQVLRTKYVRRLAKTSADPVAIGYFTTGLDKHIEEIDKLAREHEKSLMRLRDLRRVAEVFDNSLQLLVGEVKTYWTKVRAVFEADRNNFTPERWEKLEQVFKILEQKEMPPNLPTPQKTS